MSYERYCLWLWYYLRWLYETLLSRVSSGPHTFVLLFLQRFGVPLFLFSSICWLSDVGRSHVIGSRRVFGFPGWSLFLRWVVYLHHQQEDRLILLNCYLTKQKWKWKCLIGTSLYKHDFKEKYFSLIFEYSTISTLNIEPGNR